MGVWRRLKADWALLAGVLRSLRAFSGIRPGAARTIGDDIERTVDRFPDRIAIRFEGASITYAEFDAMANRYARWARGLGLKKGDCVALFMTNRPDYLACWVGLAKVGLATALINSHQTGAALAHSIAIAGAEHLVLGAELAEAFDPIRQGGPKLWSQGGDIPGTDNLDTAIAAQSGDRIPKSEARPALIGADPALYVYTSGTTGLPKAARLPHWRVLILMRSFIGSVRPGPEDRIYQSLPLYHSTGGICAVGTAFEAGAAVVLKRKFSASAFWEDCVTEKVTVFFYIGELCRYLLNQPVEEAETRHHVRAMVGNGLRPDIWVRFQSRFRVPHIYEFYGSTEGNLSLLNFDGKVGAVGRVPWWIKARFNLAVVKFDVETEAPVRGPDGLCIEAAPGEVGEALGEIRPSDPRFRFAGYRGDAQQTEKKVLHNVLKKGDAWFRTGDLLRIDKDGYVFFADRIGDTFRWKGENVSTSEVAEAIGGFPGVLGVNAYGVALSGVDGRAGMAALSLAPDADLAALHAYLKDQLPEYARPLFLRIQPQIETTGTFKYRKVDLVKDGIDPAKITDPLYFDHPDEQRYVPLTPDLHAAILSGAFKL